MIVVGVRSGRLEPSATRDTDVVAEVVQVLANWRGGPVPRSVCVERIADVLDVTERRAGYLLRRVCDDGRVARVPGVGTRYHYIPRLALEAA